MLDLNNTNQNKNIVLQNINPHQGCHSTLVGGAYQTLKSLTSRCCLLQTYTKHKHT